MVLKNLARKVVKKIPTKQPKHHVVKKHTKRPIITDSQKVSLDRDFARIGKSDDHGVGYDSIDTFIVGSSTDFTDKQLHAAGYGSLVKRKNKLGYRAPRVSGLDPHYWWEVDPTDKAATHFKKKTKWVEREYGRF